jgi:hypothetical protein
MVYCVLYDVRVTISLFRKEPPWDKKRKKRKKEKKE